MWSENATVTKNTVIFDVVNHSEANRMRISLHNATPNLCSRAVQHLLHEVHVKDS